MRPSILPFHPSMEGRRMKQPPHTKKRTAQKPCSAPRCSSTACSSREPLSASPHLPSSTLPRSSRPKPKSPLPRPLATKRWLVANLVGASHCTASHCTSHLTLVAIVKQTNRLRIRTPDRPSDPGDGDSDGDRRQLGYYRDDGGWSGRALIEPTPNNTPQTPPSTPLLTTPTYLPPTLIGDGGYDGDRRRQLDGDGDGGYDGDRRRQLDGDGDGGYDGDRRRRRLGNQSNNRNNNDSDRRRRLTGVSRRFVGDDDDVGVRRRFVDDDSIGTRDIHPRTRVRRVVRLRREADLHSVVPSSPLTPPPKTLHLSAPPLPPNLTPPYPPPP